MQNTITYLEAALQLAPEAYDPEAPSGVMGCPDFYFPQASVFPGGCHGFDCCADCWRRQYQGEAARGGPEAWRSRSGNADGRARVTGEGESFAVLDGLGLEGEETAP